MKPYVDALVREALSDATEAGLLPARTMPGFRVDAPRHAEFGDLACDVPLVLARELGEPPQALAALVVDRIRDRNGWLAGMDVGGPGFVNFRFASSFWHARLLDAVAAGAAYGRTSAGRGRRVRVTIDRARPDAAPTIADGRAGAIAGAAVRLLVAAESDVERGGTVPDIDAPLPAGGATGTPDEVVAIAAVAHAGEVARSAVREPDATAFRLLAVHPVRLTRDGQPVRGEPALAAVVDEIGRDAARFLLLLERRDRTLDLDLELAKLDGTDNPLFHARLACARLGQVTRATPPGTMPLDPSLLDDSDVESLRLLAAWPDVVEFATRAVEPHRIATHALEVAAAGHRWMNRNHLCTGNRPPAGVRLALADCLRQMLGGALALCGVSAPERIVRPDAEEVEGWTAQ
jgi:arginyl-tRNA synthetase